jgi:phenylacetate-CoA ligase
MGIVAHAVTQAARDRGACVIPASIQSSITPYPRVIDLFSRVRPTVLACLPTEAFRLAEAARYLGHDPARDFALRAICTAGELLTDARRARLAELWQAPVFNFYGCTEGGNIAADCPAGRLHLTWDHFLLEVLDEHTWEPVRPGERGVAVLTTLTREAQPLVRFVLGDQVRLLEGSVCPCGRTAPVVDHFGRDINCLEFAGRRYFVRDLEDRLLTAPTEVVGNLWLVEVRPAEVRFRVEAERFDGALYRRLEVQVREHLGLPLVIDPVAPGELLARSRLVRVQPLSKPRLVGYVNDASAPPLRLHELMEDL